jgi:catecholate siderophore receptor
VTKQSAATVHQPTIQLELKLSPLKIAVHAALLGISVVSISGNVYAGEGAAEPLKLKEVQVTAPALSDTQPVKGYNAKKSTTATKTDTDLIDVPQSISVITQDVIKDQSIQSVSDAVRYVPGVTAAQGEGNRDQLVMRGNSTTGDFYVDGVRDDIQTYRDFYNTDRIEVLKGPNGMIFGRGASGGVINRVSKEAGWDPIHQVTASYGAYNHKRISADIGQAINDVAAFRINTVYENSDSYREGYNLERYGITPTITLRPTEQTKIVLDAEYFKDDRTSDRGVPSVNGPGNRSLNNRPYDIGNYSQFFGSSKQSPNSTETKAFNAMIEHAFDNGLTIRNRTRYADYDKYYQNVFANGPVRNNGLVALDSYRDNTDRENLFNQTDLIYSLKTGQVEHKLLAGMEIGRQKTDNSRLEPTAAEGSVPATIAETNATILFNNKTRDRKSDVDITSFYLQDQLTLTPQWQVIIGLRHDKFEAKHTNVLTNQKIESTDNLLSPRAGLIFKPIANVSLYTNYSLSYVPRAGDQLTDLTFTTSSFDPEKFINKEVGAKWDVTPDLALTAAFYKLERQNVAVTNPAAPSTQILVDGQEIKGLELGVSGRLTSKWSIFGGYANQDGELTKDQSTSILKGTDLAQTPRETFSLWNKYDINPTWGVALGVISRSSMYAALPTTTTSTTLPGYTRFDAAIYGKLSEKLRLQINLENITNKDYALYAHNNNNITPGSPLSGRATLIYNF